MHQLQPVAVRRRARVWRRRAGRHHPLPHLRSTEAQEAALDTQCDNRKFAKVERRHFNQYIITSLQYHYNKTPCVLTLIV